MSNQCIFCNIAQKKINADIVYEDNNVIAFKDINPMAPVHILIIPKQHIKSVAEVEDFGIISHITKISIELAKKFNMEEKGFRLVTNCGSDGGQTVFHLHFHFLGGRKLEFSC